MKINISNPNKILDEDFINRLINFLPVLLVKNKYINKKKLNNLDDYLAKNVFTDKRKYTTKDCILIGLRNLKFKTTGYKVIIECNPTSQMPFYNISVKDICSLIDDGNLDIKGTKVFTNLFNYVKNNIQLLRHYYEIGVF